MREILGVMKALGDENRLRIVAALRGRELCLCQIVKLLELANSTVSRHMSILYQARIVQMRKEGRWCYFRLAEEDAPPAALDAVSLVLQSLQREARIRADAKRLKQILRAGPESLCQPRSGAPC